MLSSPRDLAASLRGIDRGLRRDDRADRGDRAVRGRLPDLQHAVDDRRRARPRARPAARGRGDAGQVDAFILVQALVLGVARVGSSASRSAVALAGWHRGGWIRADRLGPARARRSIDAGSMRSRRSSSGVVSHARAPRIEPARRAGRISAGRSAQVAPRTAGRPPRAPALARRGLRLRRRRSVSLVWPRDARRRRRCFARSPSTPCSSWSRRSSPFVLPCARPARRRAVRRAHRARGAARPRVGRSAIGAGRP